MALAFAGAAWGIVPTPQAAAARLVAAGLNHFYNLEYNRAIADFRRVTRLEPDQASGWNHLAQAELYREMYRIGALQSELYGHGDPFLKQKLLPVDPVAEQQIRQADQRAINLAQSAVARDPKNAHAYYDLAAAWALRANMDFSLHASYFAALGDAKTARREAEQARKLDRSFVQPLLIVGVQNYVAGSLPWTVKLFTTLVGYRGDKELGRKQVTYVAEHGGNARADAAVLLAVMDRRDGLNRQAAAWFAKLSQEYPRNVLFAVEQAEALEAAGEHDAARAQYHAVLQRATAAAPGYQRAPLDKVWYDLGKIEVVYSHWKLAAEDFDRVRSVPGARPRYIRAAQLAKQHLPQ